MIGRVEQVRALTGRRGGRPRWELFAVAGLVFSLVALTAPVALPFVAIGLWAVVGGLVLGIRHLALDLLVVGAVVGAAVLVASPDVPLPLVLVLTLFGATALTGALRRDRAVGGLLGHAGEADAMLIDLRDSVRAQGSLPDLPDGWTLEHEHRAARDEAFSGDFLVVRRHGEGRHLDLALVDVSGHGRTAGTRSVMLHGAFGALLRTVPRPGFLEAANDYLCEQQWDEGFATAVHLSVDLATGVYTVGAAGHPPPLHRHRSDGSWHVVEGEHGPVLGVLPEVPFPVSAGGLAPGDALLLYSDGLVEGRDLDLTTGIGRLRDGAEAVLARSGEPVSGGGPLARRICDASGAGAEDDRTLVVLRRHPVTSASRPLPVVAAPRSATSAPADAGIPTYR